MRIYNLFPTLAGKVYKWFKHARRAKLLGFDWIYINPFFDSSPSSIYSIKSYDKINLKFSNDGSQSLEPVLEFVNYCHNIDLRVIMNFDFTCNSIESDLAINHPEWCKFLPNGNFEHPKFIKDNNETEILSDMVQIDDNNDKFMFQLHNYRKNLIIKFHEYGFDGFIFNSTLKIKLEKWENLFKDVSEEGYCPIYIADTLGYDINSVYKLSQSKLFDYIFNSSKFWDLKADWCLEQHNRFRKHINTISFPEAHDTDRLINEFNGDIRMVKLRYTFSSIFSSAVIIPMGFEYSLKKRLNSKEISETDWNEINIDITSFIKRVNDLKKNYSIFREENVILSYSDPSSPVIKLMKISNDKRSRALIIINSDPWSYQQVCISNLHKLMDCGETIIDLSPEYCMDGVPMEFQYYLRPSQVKILYSES